MTGLRKPSNERAAMHPGMQPPQRRRPFGSGRWPQQRPALHPPPPPPPLQTPTYSHSTRVTAAAAAICCIVLALILLLALLLWRPSLPPTGAGGGAAARGTGTGATHGSVGVQVDGDNGSKHAPRKAGPVRSPSKRTPHADGANTGHKKLANKHRPRTSAEVPDQAAQQDAQPATEGQSRADGTQASGTQTNGVAVGTVDGASTSEGTEAGAVFFGLPAKGKAFGYIIDCSGSMQGARLQAAKTELLRSIHALEERQRFYVVFFSDDAYPMFGPQSVAPRSFPASTRNVRRVTQWVEDQPARGGTNPLPAFEELLQHMKPDAIFVLTDGEFEPEAVDRILELVQPRGIPVHAVCLLAQATGGRYRFVSP